MQHVLSTVIRLSVGLFVLEVLFLALQALWPGVRGRVLRREGLATDLAYWFCTPLVTRPLTGVLNGLVLLPILLALGISVREGYQGFGPVAELPIWLQVAGMLVVGDFVGYWAHRAFHEGLLWPFHAVHHSSTSVDWLSATRLHPVNDAPMRLVQALAVLLLGFSPRLLSAYIPFLTLFPIMLHANLSWDFGPLRPVLASPTFHRWHHSAASVASNKNFAGLLPMWDALFGTLYMPAGERPTIFGIGGGVAVPTTFLGLMLYPFRRKAQAAALAV